jgi:hypothetical protein
MLLDPIFCQELRHYAISSSRYALHDRSTLLHMLIVIFSYIKPYIIISGSKHKWELLNFNYRSGRRRRNGRGGRLPQDF